LFHFGEFRLNFRRRSPVSGLADELEGFRRQLALESEASRTAIEDRPRRLKAGTDRAGGLALKVEGLEQQASGALPGLGRGYVTRFVRGMRRNYCLPV